MVDRGNEGAGGPVPFRDCRARPDSADGRPVLLADHLAAVGAEAESRTPSDHAYFLRWAGYLHDLGKARASWQRRLQSDSGKRVPHAFVGAYVFFALFAGLKLSASERRLILWLTRDIACHHGELEDLTDARAPWEGGWEASAWREMDWPGIRAFLRSAFPDGPALPVTAAELAAQEAALRRTWRRWVNSVPASSDPLLSALPWSAARLVAADRFHTGEVAPVCGMTPVEASEALSRVRAFVARRARELAEQGARDMVERRSRLQEAVKSAFRQASGPMYVLQAPTGSGKTLLALELALERIAQSPGPRRLIYLAPFINLVADVAHLVREAAGLDVLEHHHLALPEEPSEAAAHRSMGEGPDGVLLVADAWQAPAVVSTFNQVFRAVFPKRAQQALRMVALENAFVVVDEPQTLAAAVWTPFVQGLEVLARQSGAEVLFMSATLPPFPGVHLARPPSILAESPHALAWPARYRLETHEGSWGVERLAQEAIRAAQERGATAVILNTVADAVSVYEAVACHKEVCAVNLHGAMHPLHKAYQIFRVQKLLRGDVPVQRPVVVVCTQVLEAGADLSFQVVFRARAVLPAMVQAAGRANRHAQSSRLAEVRVFDFVRDDGSDSRSWVYRNPVFREETDRCLPRGAAWTETALDDLLAEYYRAAFQRSPQTALLDGFRKAAEGTWSCLAGLEPFEKAPYRQPVFVPVAGPPDDPWQWIDEPTRKVLQRFHIDEIEKIYELLYDRKFMASLSQVSRRNFFNLVGRFTVSMPVKTLPILTELNPDREVQRLVDVHAYSPETGLGRWVRKDDQDEAIFL